MKTYQRASLVITEFDVEDVITTSGITPEPTTPDTTDPQDPFPYDPYEGIIG